MTTAPAAFASVLDRSTLVGAAAGWSDFGGKLRALRTLAIAALTFAAGFAAYPALRALKPFHIDRYIDTSDRREIPCPPQTSRTLVAVVFGQSNSANHLGQRYTSERVVNAFNGRCFIARDPLLGATGNAGSLWTLLGDKLLNAGRFDAIVLIPAGVGSSTVKQWGDLDFPESRYSVTHYLWHQGEADAGRLSAKEYADALRQVIQRTKQASPNSAFYVSIASVCNGAPDQQIRDAQMSVLGPGIFQGPDTDKLAGEDRFDGCHFSARAQERIADAWLSILK